MGEMTQALRRMEQATAQAVALKRINKYNTDELVRAVQQAADEIDGMRKVERREQRRVEARPSQVRRVKRRARRRS